MNIMVNKAWNDTMDSMSHLEVTSTVIIPNTMVPVSRRHITFASQIILTLVYLTGVIGNISALVILFHRDKRRNRKHLLMLRCLVLNDLVALLGMLVQMYLTIYVGHVFPPKTSCSFRVVWRLFGLFSGCVAIVMAAERWLALTRPFLYQKVTYPVIVRCMLGLWLAAAALSSLPLLGFGLYYKGDKCKRYREATEPEDIAYAYVFFFFGTVLCLCIVWCNLAVSRALSRLGRRDGTIRRISRASSRATPLLTVAGPPPPIVPTVEEKAFSRLMAVLSISFVICWMPQMISIPLAQYSMTLPATATGVRKFIGIFHVAAEILLCIHFTLDPYIYVLLRQRPRFPLLKPLCKIFYPGRRSRSSSFTGTTDHQGSSGDPPTPITEAPSTSLSDENELQLMAANA